MAIWFSVGILVVASAIAFILVNVGSQAVAPVTGGVGEEIGDVSVPVIIH